MKAKVIEIIYVSFQVRQAIEKLKKAKIISVVESKDGLSCFVARYDVNKSNIKLFMKNRDA